MVVEGEPYLRQETRQGKVIQYVTALFGCLLVCLLYYFFMVATARVEVDIEVEQTTVFKIYWAAPDSGYSEARAAGLKVHPGKSDYSFYLTNLGRVGRLRIDTQEYAGQAKLKRLGIHQEGYESIEFSPVEGFEGMRPLGQVEELIVDDSGLLIRSGGEDPNFEYTVAADRRTAHLGALVLRFLIVASAALVVSYCCAPFVPKLTIVPILLFGAWVLIFTMAGVSKKNVHPDEYVHIAAVSYYTDHWMPPHMEDPEIRDSYSVYGVSRLNSKEVYYFFAGKVCRVLQVFNLPEPLVFRGFNVMLFAALFFLTIRNVSVRFAALPFLLSPQIWYVFSYCDSDAFALFFTFLAACQLIDPQSLLHRHLKGEGGWSRLIALVLLPLMLGIILLLKKNYYPFLGLFFLMLGMQVLFTEEYFWERKEAIRRVAVICLLACCVAGVRFGANYAVNGSDISVKKLAMEEKYGDYEYRTSTPVEEQHPFIHMRARGIALEDLYKKFHWGQKTYESAFGVFGYLSIHSPHHYYTLVKWAGGTFLCFLFMSSLMRGGSLGIGATVFGSTLSVALIGFSLYHSWVDDFQAQGRYLLPIVSMMSVVLGYNIKALNRNILLYLIGVMYLLSLYSFIFQGLFKIPKLPF